MTAEPPLFFRSHIFCCNNVRPPNDPHGSCGRHNANELRDYMKTKAKEMGLKGVRVNASGCLDRCELGPVFVIYPEGVWYHVDTVADVDEILVEHVQKGGRVERLMLKPGDEPPVNPKPNT